MSAVGRTVALCVGFIVAVVGLYVYSIVRTPQLSVDELRDQGVFLMPRPRDIAPFELQDHTGAPYNRESLNGKWTFIFFGFTYCPDVCPVSMSEMGKADASIRAIGGELADQFQGILVSVDPERDTEQILGDYATAFSPRFLGVRGEISTTGLFAQQVNTAFAKVPDDNGGYTLDHSGNIVIINPHGHYHGFIKLPHKAETISLAYQSIAAQF